MQYFTPDRHVALRGAREPGALAAADAAWQEQVDRYEADLHARWGELPASVARLLDSVQLGGAALVSLGRGPESLVATLQLAAPPGELLTLTYALAGEPAVARDLFPASCCAARPTVVADELTGAPGAGEALWHRLLLGNGWEVAVPFREVRWSVASALYPLPDESPSPPCS